ncbi:MAG: hypothetical protein ACT4P5_09200 [Armatimonadota bacterium]
MTLTVKLRPELEQQLALHCRAHRLAKSEVVARLIEGYLGAQRATPYELARRLKLVGAQRRAPAAARDHASYLKARLRARRVA